MNNNDFVSKAAAVAAYNANFIEKNQQKNSNECISKKTNSNLFKTNLSLNFKGQCNNSQLKIDGGTKKKTDFLTIEKSKKNKRLIDKFCKAFNPECSTEKLTSYDLEISSKRALSSNKKVIQKSRSPNLNNFFKSYNRETLDKKTNKITNSGSLTKNKVNTNSRIEVVNLNSSVNSLNSTVNNQTRKNSDSSYLHKNDHFKDLNINRNFVYYFKNNTLNSLNDSKKLQKKTYFSSNSVSSFKSSCQSKQLVSQLNLPKDFYNTDNLNNTDPKLHDQDKNNVEDAKNNVNKINNFFFKAVNNSLFKGNLFPSFKSCNFEKIENIKSKKKFPSIVNEKYNLRLKSNYSIFSIQTTSKLSSKLSSSKINLDSSCFYEFDNDFLLTNSENIDSNYCNDYYKKSFNLFPQLSQKNINDFKKKHASTSSLIHYDTKKYPIDINKPIKSKNLADSISQYPQSRYVSFRSTMRKMNKKQKKVFFNEDKPWKSHNKLTYIQEQERKRYEGVWVTNKNSYMNCILTRIVGIDYSKINDEEQKNEHVSLKAARISSITKSFNDNNLINFEIFHNLKSCDITQLIHGIVVKRIWKRSRLPDEKLKKIWNLIDFRKDGTLNKHEFIVGMWLIDQCLYGRKLPNFVSDIIWKSSNSNGVI